MTMEDFNVVVADFSPEKVHGLHDQLFRGQNYLTFLQVAALMDGLYSKPTAELVRMELRAAGMEPTTLFVENVMTILNQADELYYQ